jgi:catechol 2,3-dioxygenase-like lactoylglutathione lyase family enzyme
MLRGVATVTYWADDVEAARRWYAELLGTEPYFARSVGSGSAAYYEFRLGDYQQELELIDRRYVPEGSANGPGGVIAHWQVDDVSAALARLPAMGATEHEAVRERGAGFITASVVDPYGNILGNMGNPHYLEVLRSTRYG